ncbi:hypothetical protein [Chamaesiphon sp. VAR_48_metabat_403]|uniref:hypothetical protein n=1 Tax=Chamaesiphon sp. VAR_48_metabat_403 TaxID=2964700 RepID=UPI00286E25B4|nr:hypothetical protein [Chamaesiphon sp. VAR_48_metabat_403]
MKTIDRESDWWLANVLHSIEYPRYTCRHNRSIAPSSYLFKSISIAVNRQISEISLVLDVYSNPDR